MLTQVQQSNEMIALTEEICDDWSNLHDLYSFAQNPFSSFLALAYAVLDTLSHYY